MEPDVAEHGGARVRSAGVLGVLGVAGHLGRPGHLGHVEHPGHVDVAGTVTVPADTRTARLVLHPVDEQEARRIVDRRPAPDDAWAADYPFAGDLVALGQLLRATAESGDQRPFGYYQLRRLSDGLAIGGIGFKGPPADGAVEVGYGLAPSGRGHGHAAEALRALMRVAAGLGVATMLADTDADNVASQRTLERAGLRRVGDDPQLWRYEAQL